MSDIITPIIHLNGDRKATLVNALETAYDALSAAERALCACAPNGRNYYPDPGRYEKAERQHVARLAHLAALLASLEGEMNAIQRENPERR